MNRTLPLAAMLVVLVGGGLAACGVNESDAAVAATSADAPASTPSSAADDPLVPKNTNYENIPGMAMGSPPETASMNCADKKTCDLVFIAPTDAIVRPFGLTVRLMRSDEKQAVISVGGKEYVVTPGKTVKVGKATVKLVGTPGSVVTLNFRSA